MFGILYSNTKKFANFPNCIRSKILSNGILFADGNIDSTTLDSNLQNTINTFKMATGEYAFLYITENHFVFCTDEFSQRSLWYYYNKEQKILSIATVPEILKQKHKEVYNAKDNLIYIVDRNTFELNTITNTNWDLTQKDNHFDFVFEAFEQAIKDRYEPNNTSLLLSSGLDSGVVFCAAHKLFKDLHVVSDAKGEDNEILKSRYQMCKPKMFFTFPSQLETKKILQTEICNGTLFDDTGVESLIHMMKSYVLPQHSVVIGGNGADNVYVHRILNDKVDHFPADLKTIYPWHNQYGRIEDESLRWHLLTAHFGLTARNPLLDQNLFQKWLNTNVKCKQKYKQWIVEYCKEHNFAYTLEKGKWRN